MTDGGVHVSIRSSTTERLEEFHELGDLLAAGHIRAVIDRRYALEEIGDAHRYAEEGHKRGNVVVEVR